MSSLEVLRVESWPSLCGLGNRITSAAALLA
jgi:hypothetical protein